MKITKGTIIRTVMTLIVIINLFLKGIGKPIIEVDEGTVVSTLETILELAVIVVAWWKNNSFSENAIRADEFLEDLKNEEEY